MVAKECGLDTIFEPGGVHTLTNNMREMVFPLTTQEAKELFALQGRGSATLGLRFQGVAELCPESCLLLVL